MEAQEKFADNPWINLDIHAILDAFPEPSRGRMRKKIRQVRDAINPNDRENTDAAARHIYREFLPAHRLRTKNVSLEYSPKFGNQTPDWYGASNNLLLEVYTCERGGSLSVILRVANNINEKIAKYRHLIDAQQMHFVVGVHGDFLSAFERIDFDDMIRENSFDSILSGLIFFAEDRQGEAIVPRGQPYGYWYWSNARASRPIDLSVIGTHAPTTNSP